jgi:hypothetical protein
VPHLSHPWFTNISTEPHLSFAFRSWPHFVIHILTKPHLSVTFRFLWPQSTRNFSGHFSVRISEWATYTNFIHFGLTGPEAVAVFEPYSHWPRSSLTVIWPHSSLTSIGRIRNLQSLVTYTGHTLWAYISNSYWSHTWATYIVSHTSATFELLSCRTLRCAASEPPLVYKHFTEPHLSLP